MRPWPPVSWPPRPPRLSRRPSRRRSIPSWAAPRPPHTIRFPRRPPWPPARRISCAASARTRAVPGSPCDFRTGGSLDRRRDTAAGGHRVAAGRGRSGGRGADRDRVGQRGQRPGAIAVYGVKHLRYSGFAGHDAPLAAYGVVTCPSRLAPADRRRAGATPPVARLGVRRDSRTRSSPPWWCARPSGTPLFRFGPAADDAYLGDTATAGAGWPVFRASLPAVGGRPADRDAAGIAAAAALRVARRDRRAGGGRAAAAPPGAGAGAASGDFTSSVSHELRTPLTQILLFAETLQLGRAGGEGERRQALGIIVQEARRLAHLVENVLHLSRAERRMVRVQAGGTASRAAVAGDGGTLRAARGRSRPAGDRAGGDAGGAGACRLAAPDRDQPARQRGEVRATGRAGDAPRVAGGGPCAARRGGCRSRHPAAADRDEGVGAVRPARALARRWRGAGSASRSCASWPRHTGGAAGSRTRRAAARSSWSSCRSAAERRRKRRPDGRRSSSSRTTRTSRSVSAPTSSSRATRSRSRGTAPAG